MNNKIFLLVGGILATFVVMFFFTNVSVDVPEAESAQVDYFLKIDDIKGESSDKGHKDEIDILSWSWGFDKPVDSSTGRTTGKVSVHDVILVKEVDASSPELMHMCARADHIPKIQLTTKDNQRGDYLKYTFENSFCTGFSVSADGGNIPTESLSFNFSKVRVEYKPKKESGILESAWDFATGSE